MSRFYKKAVLMAGLFVATSALANLSSTGLSEVQDLIAAGQPAEALRKIDALLAKTPDDPHLRFQKGVLLVDQKRTNDAIALFERMSRDFPTLPEPWNNLAVLYAEQGQMEKARAALESAVRSRPSYSTAYENLSSLNVRLASRAYARALHIDDSGGAPKLAMLKSLAGSRSDNAPIVIAAATPAPSPAPAPAPAPVAVAPAAVAPRPSTAVEAPVAVAPAAVAPRPSTAVEAPVTKAAPAVAAPAPAPAKPAAREEPAPPPAKPAAREEPATPAKAAVRDEPSTASKVKPATADASQRKANDDAREVQSAVEAWASAWERKDMNAYFASYVPGFTGNDGSSSKWQDGRRLRILGKSRISIELVGVTVEMVGNDGAKVSFRQNYSADQLDVTGQKVLELVKRNGKWLIRKESVGS